MQEDKIKQAFAKAKQDILNLQAQIQEIKRTLLSMNQPTQTLQIPTHQQENQTDKQPLKTLKPQILPISTGNQGVPTDRQTDRQTDRHTQKFAQIQEKTPPITPQQTSQDQISRMEKVSEVLESLDDIKKDLRSKFKRLTDKEMLIFSTIYQFEAQDTQVDYPLLANKLSLSESSIRDYIFKITKKGIPIDKTKENNKKITLSIPNDFKKLASLQTIIQLRGL